jgi:hypothetical protein
MSNLIAAVYFLLSLVGIQGMGTTITTRPMAHGVEQMHSRIHVLASVARFECLSSASGTCHYTLFPRACGPRSGACARPAFDRFTMPAGTRREMVGLPDFSPCVAPDDAPMGADCRTPPAAQ